MPRRRARRTSWLPAPWSPRHGHGRRRECTTSPVNLQGDWDSRWWCPSYGNQNPGWTATNGPWYRNQVRQRHSESKERWKCCTRTTNVDGAWWSRCRQVDSHQLACTMGSIDTPESRRWSRLSIRDQVCLHWHGCCQHPRSDPTLSLRVQLRQQAPHPQWQETRREKKCPKKPQNGHNRWGINGASRHALPAWPKVAGDQGETKCTIRWSGASVLRRLDAVEALPRKVHMWQAIEPGVPCHTLPAVTMVDAEGT